MKLLVALLCGGLWLTPARADWFLSDAVKATIAKAEAGDVQAQFRVANAYDFGKGAPHDEDVALQWYRKAAEQGHVEAMNSIGSLLQAQKRYAEARSWFEKAAAHGHALATNNLAYLYDLGLGVSQDRQRGFELYTKAADLGWAEAMWNLANMYGAGQVGPVDLGMACVWTYRAERYAQPGDRVLRKRLAQVKPQLLKALSDEQLDTCLKQYEAWTPHGSEPVSPSAGVFESFWI